MQFLEPSFTAAHQAGAALLRDHGAALPAVTFAALADFYPSPVNELVTTCEALWASVDHIPAAAQTYCAQLAQIAVTFSFGEALGHTDRGARIVAGVRRRLGELTEAEAPAANDPEPLAQFVPPAA